MLWRFEKIIFFLTILFLPTQLGRHFWPQFSHIYSLPIDYLSPTIYFWDLLVLFLISIFLIQKKKFSSLPLNLFLFFIFTQLLSLLPFLSPVINPGAGFVRFGQYITAGLFGVYVASSRQRRGSPEAANIITPLTLGAVFESVLAIAQFIKGGSLFFWILGERSFSVSTPAIATFDYQGLVFLRPYGTFSHPNVLAAFLLVVLILLLNYKTSKTFLKNAIIWLLTLTIFLTVSRASIVVLTVLLVINYGKKYLKQLFFLFILISPIIITRFSSLLNYDNISLIRRSELSQTAFSFFISSPFFGVGLNNFIPFISSEIISGSAKFLQPVHNIYLLALSETGIIGFIGWIILLRFIIQDRKVASFAYNSLFIILIWTSIFFLGLFDHYFLTLPQGQRIIFLVWGLTLVEWKHGTNNKGFFANPLAGIR